MKGGFDCADAINRDTAVTATYRNTQNARRFLTEQCGENFAFDRPVMAWIKNGRRRQWVMLRMNGRDVLRQAAVTPFSQ
ncbi:DUF6434 domain-containing protein [Pararhizobium sp. LjRoot235]|uniref:DUF6434 domain-containing protein n=1 Tax=Pararhizobium sp. LjRoot235 TaxID=3342291 RepID=UPI003ECE7835